MQGGNTTTLFTQVGKIESKLLDITSTVHTGVGDL
jgi:hypothetical protein